MILSFDVGTKNLSLCKIDKEKNIHKWELISVGSVSVSALCNKLDDIEGLMTDVSLVVIEKQVRANIKMIRMSAMLETWCFIRNKHAKICLCPAVKRLEFVGYERDMKLSKSQQYRSRKNACVEYAKYVLYGSDWLSILEDSKKKDDLAVSFCQTLVYIS